VATPIPFSTNKRLDFLIPHIGQINKDRYHTHFLDLKVEYSSRRRAPATGILHNCYHRVKNCLTWCQSKMNYCNVVYGFIDYTLSNSRNISEGDIKCLCKRCKNKKFLDLDVVTMHLLQKKVHKEIHVLVCTRRTIYSLRDHSRKGGYVNF
jgi:hypothetical protein